MVFNITLSNFNEFILLNRKESFKIFYITFKTTKGVYFMFTSKKLLKAGYILCMILFYITAVFGGIFVVIDHVFHLWFPDHPVTVFLGPFEPVFAYVNLYFYEQPELYNSTSFLTLSFLGSIFSVGIGLLFLWYVSRLIKNIDKIGLFNKVNVSILYKLGTVTLILGTISDYLDSFLLKQAIQELEIGNADFVLTDFSYLGSLLSGIVLILFAAALKKAVHAIEEK